MSKSYTTDYFEDRKLKYEKNHGNFIHEFMFNEYQTRILGQCNVALNDLQRQLDEEITRAKAEEARLDQKIDAETTRAKAEEVRLDGKIDSETSRAKAEETRLDGKIDAETARATGEETRLDGKIDTEKTRLDGKIDAETARAKGRENELNDKIDTEKTRLNDKIDVETARATGRENELSTSINACLPKAGGTMSDSGVIKWDYAAGNVDPQPFTMGGLTWSGASDYVAIAGAVTGRDNMNLVFNMGDDNSNAIVFTNAENTEVASIHSDGVYTGTIDWSHIKNRPEMDKQALDNLNLNLTTLRQAYMDLKARVDKLDGRGA